MSRDDRSDVELALRIETAMCGRNLLTKQSIGADKFTILQPYCARIGGPAGLHHHEMIADGIEIVLVSFICDGVAIGPCAHLFIENTETQFLACGDFI